MLKSKKLLVSMLLSIFILASFMSSFSFAVESGENLDANTVEEATEDLDSITIDESTDLEELLSSSTTEGSSSLLSTPQVLEGDQFITENSVKIDTPVSGNLFIFSNDATIDALVDGNVFFFGSKLTIAENTQVYSCLFAFGQEININGLVYDLYSFSPNLTIGEQGYVYRNANIFSQNTTIKGVIGKNANIYCDHLTIDPANDLAIGGNLNCTSPSDIEINDEFVGGEVNFTKEVKTDSEKSTNFSPMGLIMKFIYFFVVILLLVLVSTKFASNSEKALKTKLGASFGFGALALLLTPIVSVILLITIVGLWVGLVSFLLYCLLISICLPVVSVALGKLISSKLDKNSKPWTLLFGVLIAIVIYALGLVPYLGFIVDFVVAMLGLGIIIFTVFPPKAKAESKKDTEKEIKE